MDLLSLIQIFRVFLEWITFQYYDIVLTNALSVYLIASIYIEEVLNLLATAEI